MLPKFGIRILIPVILMVLASSATAVAQDPELIVEVSQTKVYLGEPVTYDVTVNHIDSPAEPQVALGEDFRVELVGRQPLNSQRITIINGRKSEIVRRGMLFRYRLTPLRSGRLNIPPPSLDVEGVRLNGDATVLVVEQPPEQDAVRISMSTDRDVVYPTQPFSVAVTIAVRRLPGELSTRSPLSVQGTSPVRLAVPWLDEDMVPEGLKADPWRELLVPLISESRTPDGFQINEIGQQSSGFSFFASRQQALFMPSSEERTLAVAGGATATFLEYRLQRRFVPERVGEFYFHPVRVKGSFGDRIEGGRLEGETVYALSAPLVVKARGAPKDGRPDSYLGGIGQFRISADVAPREATVGEPVTLTLIVRGTGATDDLVAPDINQIPAIADNFKTYDATTEAVSNGRMFTYSLRPLSESVSALPEIPVSWFDPTTETYVTEATEIIPLTVTSAKTLDSSEIQTSRSVSGNAGDLRMNEDGLFANHSSLRGLRGGGQSAAFWLGTWCTMIVGYLVVSFGIRRRQSLLRDPLTLRRRQAVSRATEAIHAVASAAGDDTHMSPDALGKVIAGLISDFTGHSEAGITPLDAEQLLRRADVGDDLIECTVGFLQSCDAARYGAAQNVSAMLAADCRQLIEELGAELHARCQ